MMMSKEKGLDRFHKREQQQKDYKLQLPGEDEDSLPTPVDPIHTDQKPNRNDPCPCGSGKKYKKCCGKSKG